MDVRGKSVALVGGWVTLDKVELVGLLTAAGALPSKSLTKKTQLVVLGDKPGKAGQRAADRARLAGIAVHSEAELAAWLEALGFVRAPRRDGEGTALPIVRRLGDGAFLHPRTLDGLSAGETWVAGCGESGVRVWDKQGELRGTFETPARYSERVDLFATTQPGELVLGPASAWSEAPFRRLRVDEAGLALLAEVNIPTARGGGYHRTARADGDGLVVGESSRALVVAWDGSVEREILSALVGQAEHGVALGEAHVAFIAPADGRVAIQRLSDGEVVTRLSMENAVGTEVAAFLPGDVALVTAHSRMYLTELRVWELPSGTLRSTINSYVGPGQVMSLHVAPSGRRVVYRQTGIDVVCVDLEAERVVWALDDVALNAPVAFDGETVWLGDARRAVPVDFTTGARRPTGLPDDCAAVEVVGHTVLAQAAKEVILFDARDGAWAGREASETLRAIEGRGEVLLQRRPVAQGFAREVSRYDVAQGLRQPLFDGVVHDVDEASGVLAVGSAYFARPREVTVHGRSGRVRRRLRKGESEGVAVSPDGSVVLATARLGLAAWTSDAGKLLWKTSRAHAGPVTWLGCSPDGARCFSADTAALAVRSLRSGAVELFLSLAAIPAGIGFIDADALFVVYRDGGVERLDLPSGTAARVAHLDLEVTAAGLGAGGLLALGTTGGEVVLVDAGAALGVEGVVEVVGDFLPADVENTEAGWLAALEGARWEALEVERDVARVREGLAALEATTGIGAAHRSWTQALSERGVLQLGHGQGHTASVVGFGLSGCGRYLATASWLPEGEYEAGGSLVIWDVTAGRAVNTLTPIEGGIGWPGYGECVQWSPDGRFVGLAFSTNAVGHVLPFGEVAQPLTNAMVTNGWSRPPAFCWSPDSRQLAVGCWGPAEVPGCVIELDRTRLGEDRARWFARTRPESIRAEDGTMPELQPQKALRWFQDGRIVGHNNHGQALAVDAATGELRYLTLARTPAAWSPDGRRLAHCAVGLVLYDAETGRPTMDLPMVMGATTLRWSADSRRLAMVVDETSPYGADPGVHIYEGAQLLCSIDTCPQRAAWDFTDGCPWAWSPDGESAAVLVAGGAVEIWEVGPSPARIRILDSPHKVSGVLWGANGVVIGISENDIVFWSSHTGAILGAFEVGTHPEGATPLRHRKGDVGASFDVDPSFGLDGRWACAFPDGTVLADPTQAAQLDDAVAWVAARRIAWPWRWGEGRVFGDLAALLEAPACPIGASDRASLRRRTIRKKPPTDAPSTAG